MMHRAGAIALATLSLAACNVITGAEGVELDDGNDNDNESLDGTEQAAATTGVGGATGATVGSGGSTTTTTTTSTSASTAATSGAGGDPTTATSSGVTGGGGGEMCGGSGPGTTPLDAEETAFLGIINAYRSQNGLGALTHCVSLDRTAQGHSEDMRDQDYFDHIGLNGSSPWDRACDACYDLGCGPNTAMAENIAAGNSGAQATFDQWKNSPGHNANMLDGDFTMIGIGRATGGGQYGVYWTNVFGGADEPSCF